MAALADKKFEDALNAFLVARDIKTTDQATEAAVENLQRRVDLETSAEQVTANIRAILDDGRPSEAAKLAGDALQQFGNSESSNRLLKLKREADSLLSVEFDNRKSRFDHFRQEYETAIKSGSKRAALLALEQALQNGDDNDLNKKLHDLQREIKRYDDLRSQANDANRDPSRLAEAVAALQEALKLWSNTGIRQELELMQLESQMVALNARDRLAVADFEVRGEIGLPQAGQFVADELLPAFKAKFDLVERNQLNKVANELKLRGESLIDDPDGRREVTRLVKARYLVVGSIAAVNGITVHARLLDVETGLIVQTGRIVAQTPEQLTQRLPQLAEELLMTDADKQAAEQQQGREAVPVEVVKAGENLELPPPPEPLGEIPPPVIPPRPKPPEVKLLPEQLDNLAPPPPPDQVVALPVISPARDRELRRRLLLVSVELGDNCFRRRQFREAQRHFEFALELFPELHEVRLRVEHCRPLVAPVVVFPNQPVPIVRPRLAVLDFLVVGSERVIPPQFGWRVPENLAPYFSPDYELVDRSELFWWMGRLGITPVMLLNDPAARLYLGRAIGARYFLFGNVMETASLNVTTYLVDAEFGFLASSARIHVRRLADLKYRLSELAWLTKMTAAERRRFESENAQWELLLNDIQQARQQNNMYARCIELCNKGLALRPGNVQLQVILHEMTQRLKRLRDLGHASDIDGRDNFTERERQLALARATELARLKAEATPQADRQRIQRQREAAAERLILQAQALVRAKQYSSAVMVFESAVALQPEHDTAIRELAQARARVEESRRAELAEAQAAREAAIRRQREQELAEARAQLEIEHKRQQEIERARRMGIEERDRREYDRLLDFAQKQAAKQDYDQAVAAAQRAKRLRSTPEADRLLSQLLIELARANAEKKSAAAKADLERQLAAEQKARLAAEADIVKSSRMYEQLLIQGQQLLKAGKLAESEQKFLTARKIHESDAALTGLKQVQAARVEADAKLEAERQQEAERKRQADELKQKLAAAQSALAAKQTEKALNFFREAKKLAPTNIEILAGLAKAEQLQEQELAAAHKQAADKAKRESFQRLLKSGKANLAAKRYEAASLALGEALKLSPDDKEAKDALAEANAKLAAETPPDANSQYRSAEYQRHMSNGRQFLAAKQYDKALQSFRNAQTLMKADKAAEEFATEAQRLKAEAEKARAEEYRKAQVAGQNASRITAALTQFRNALRKGKLDEAAGVYRSAAALDASHPDVIAALADLRKAQDAAAAAKSATEASERKKKDFAKFMSQAQEQFQAKRFDEAAKSVAAAVALFPNDQGALALQRRIDQGMRDVAIAAQKRQQFNKYIQQGRSALAEKKFAEAVKAFESATELFPNDLEASKGLVDAKKALESPKPMAKPPLYTRQMDQGTALERAGRYEQALAAYKAALRVVPNDADANKKADFCQFMVDGDKAMRTRKFADARAAFENALKLFPDDATARSSLQKAKLAK